MKNLTAWILLGFFPLLAGAAQPWQEITIPTVAQAADSFANPPREYAAIHWAIWGGLITRERILNDIERINASGGGVYMINSSRSLQPVYFTPEYLNLVKYAVDECKKRGMKVWIEGDAGYPDGFAGGMITKDYPELGMQGIVPDARYTVAAGQTLSIPLPTDTLGIFANQRDAAAGNEPAPDQGQPLTIPADGKLKWTGPSGATWDVKIRSPGGVGHYSVVAGQVLSITVPPDTQSIEAGPRLGVRGGRGGISPSTIIPLPADGQFKWTAPATGNWDVTFVRHVHRSSPTRYSDRADGTADKDALYSLIDYLDPQATATYIKLIHETYAKLVGDEFGKTILGFRCDETDFTGIMPWTPKLMETFKQQKGYDLQPYIAGFFAYPLTEEERRAKADYWDVWSGMFRDNFYNPLQEWCQARGMEYMIHQNHIAVMLAPNGGEGNITNEGSFWRDMRYMGVPGIDNLSGMGPGIIADFPKLAGSAAHLYGRPLVWDEEGGSTGQSGKFIVDYQLVRGINYMNIRGLNTAGLPGESKGLLDAGSATGWYVTRSQHLLALGRPAAQVALYHPTDSYWMGDKEADTVTVKLTTELMEHQIDFDHIDQDSIASICTIENGELKNLSGQGYRAIIVPTSTVIEKGVLDRLREFAAAGGKVIFVGRTPALVVDQTFLHAGGPPDLSFATLLEPKPDITDAVVAALPKPDVKLDSPCPPIKYIRRTLSDGDVYFFFNESAETQFRTATLAGNGTVQIWDANDGTVHPLAGVAPADGSVDVPLVLAPYEARLIVIGTLPPGAALPLPARTASETLLALDGNWSVTMGQKPTDTPLKSWQALGNNSFKGIAEYRKSFDLTGTPPQGRRMYLDLGNVGEIAHVNLNGTDYDSRGWTPFVWDVTDSIKPSDNMLVIQVQVPAPSGRGFGPPPGSAAGSGRGAGRAGGSGGPGGAGRAGGAGRSRGFGGGGGQTEPPAPHGLLGPVLLISAQ